MLAIPEEKVKVAVPVAPVVTVPVLSKPVSVLKVTTVFGTGAFELVTAVTVTVVVVELSDLTVVGTAERAKTTAALRMVKGREFVPAPLPHPPIATRVAIRVTAIEDRAMSRPRGF